MNEINQTPINPKGFTNAGNIQGVFGEQMPNTFTRNVNNPNVPTTTPMSAPVAPPAGVDMPVTPNYDINTY